MKRFAKHIGIGTPLLFKYIAQGVGFCFANNTCYSSASILQTSMHLSTGGRGQWQKENTFGKTSLPAYTPFTPGKHPLRIAMHL
ncbi:MAG: hypothetical protein IPJ66_11925 [Bacteroidetes bacterium]|nr:hypothetical protein [Bacteroidota bacterium]